MRREIEWVEQRTRRYWYEDGLGELAIGCVVLLVGLLFLVEGLAPTGLLPDHFSSLGLIVLVFGGSWLANRVVATLKARLTYPRTGYVAYRRPTARRRILTGVAAGALGALVAGVLRAAPAALAWIPLLQGLLIAAFLLYLAHTLGLAR
ncbi:MAG: hypothetical protein HY690_08090, partial [Chloroflexi bacterium]|nr:hypothetical protein [Chloroflexota bacterium]